MGKNGPYLRLGTATTSGSGAEGQGTSWKCGRSQTILDGLVKAQDKDGT